MNISQTKNIKSISSLLEKAALYPQQREQAIEQGLALLANYSSMQGAGCLRWNQHKQDFTIHYAGIKKELVLKRLQQHLANAPAQAPMELIKHHTADFFPHLEPTMLNFQALDRQSIWFVWPKEKLAHIHSQDLPEHLLGLEEYFAALTEVEAKEGLYFSDHNILKQFIMENEITPTLLTLAKIISGADVVYWGDIYEDTVLVDTHIGGFNRDFGFKLPIGEGLGGRLALKPTIYQMQDYLNSEFRYPGVSTVLDHEGIQSGLVFPVIDKSSLKTAFPQTKGLLYATKRSTQSFSLAERLLLTRLTQSLQLNKNNSTPQKKITFVNKTNFIQEKKKELRQLLLYSNKLNELEQWLTDIIKGKVVIFEQDGQASSAEASTLSSHPTEEQNKIHIELENKKGGILLYPSLQLPFKEWPDFLQDVGSTCQVIMERTEKRDLVLPNKRKSWLEQLLRKESNEQLYYEGYHLGLPVEQGEVWTLAFTKQDQMKTQTLCHLANQVAIQFLHTPLTLLHDRLGVLLLKGQTEVDPSLFRDRLLQKLGSQPIWLVHGAGYHSLQQLSNSLIQSVELVKKLRATNSRQHVSTTGFFGLEGLISHPKMHKYLLHFSKQVLEPLTQYDVENQTQLTETFILLNVLGSTKKVAEQLYIHVNTVHYRLKKVEEVLHKDLKDPEIETAFKLASFIHYYQH